MWAVVLAGPLEPKVLKSVDKWAGKSDGALADL